MRPLRSFWTNVCCVSDRPISQGQPAFLIEVSADAPVPPSWPEMRMPSALPFDTPAAIVPTPVSETSFTLTLPYRLAFFRSWISCDRSSIE